MVPKNPLSMKKAYMLTAGLLCRWKIMMAWIERSLRQLQKDGPFFSNAAATCPFRPSSFASRQSSAVSKHAYTHFLVLYLRQCCIACKGFNSQLLACYGTAPAIWQQSENTIWLSMLPVCSLAAAFAGAFGAVKASLAPFRVTGCALRFSFSASCATEAACASARRC